MHVHVLRPCKPYFKREFDSFLEDESQINKPHISQRCSTISSISSISRPDCDINYCITNRQNKEKETIAWIKPISLNFTQIPSGSSQDTQLEFYEEYFDMENRRYTNNQG